jgi:hypothetical protein
MSTSGYKIVHKKEAFKFEGFEAVMDWAYEAKFMYEFHEMNFSNEEYIKKELNEVFMEFSHLRTYIRLLITMIRACYINHLYAIDQLRELHRLMKFIPDDILTGLIGFMIERHDELIIRFDKTLLQIINNDKEQERRSRYDIVLNNSFKENIAKALQILEAIE